MGYEPGPTWKQIVCDEHGNFRAWCDKCLIRLEREEEEREGPEFPAYVGWDGQEHAEY